MASTKTEICNWALSLIGNEAVQISDFDTDTGKQARQCRLHYQQTLDEILRMHTWNCSKKRLKLIGTVPSITEENQGPFTDADSNLNGKAQFQNSGDTYRIQWSTTNERWEYGSWSDPTLTVHFYNESDTLIPPETGWVYVAGTPTELTLTMNYDFGFDRAYQVPSDCIRPLFLINTDNSYRYYKSNIDWSIEEDTILTNYDDVYLLYINEPSIADMDSLFVNAFYTLLAIKLAIPVAGDDKRKLSLYNEFMQVIMPEARRVNSFEGQDSNVIDSEWLEATFISPSITNQSYPPFASNSHGTFNW